jgi:hypothetical protein
LLAEKVGKLSDVTHKMRKDYQKELIHYKEQERQRKHRLVHYGHLTLDAEEESICISVDYFDSLLGIDESVMKLINERLEKMKHFY